MPLTLQVYSLRQVQATASSFLPNVATCLASMAAFQGAGQIDWATAALVAVSATATTRVGARVASHMPERMAKLLFGAAMCAMGPITVLKPLLLRRPPPAEAPPPPLPLPPPPHGRQVAQPPLPPLPPPRMLGRLQVPAPSEAVYLLALGTATGLCSGVLGIGTGTMCTVGLAAGCPACDSPPPRPLALLPIPHLCQCPRRLPRPLALPPVVRSVALHPLTTSSRTPLPPPAPRCAAAWSHKLVMGTAFAAQLPAHAMAAWTHWQLGNVRTDLTPWLLLGSGLGATVASRLATAAAADEEMLRRAFAAYALVLGANSLRAGWALPPAASRALAAAAAAASGTRAGG